MLIKKIKFFSIKIKNYIEYSIFINNNVNNQFINNFLKLLLLISIRINLYCYNSSCTDWCSTYRASGMLCHPFSNAIIVEVVVTFQFDQLLLFFILFYANSTIFSIIKLCNQIFSQIALKAKISNLLYYFKLNYINGYIFLLQYHYYFNVKIKFIEQINPKVHQHLLEINFFWPFLSICKIMQN